MLSCKKVIELLCDYQEGTLAPVAAREVGTHIDGCPSCGAFRATYQRTSSLCRDGLRTEMPEQMVESLDTFLRRELSSEQTG